MAHMALYRVIQVGESCEGIEVDVIFEVAPNPESQEFTSGDLAD